MHKIWELLIRYAGLPLIEKAISYFVESFKKWRYSKKLEEIKKTEQEIIDAINKEHLSKDDVRRINSDLREL